MRKYKDPEIQIINIHMYKTPTVIPSFLQRLFFVYHSKPKCWKINYMVVDSIFWFIEWSWFPDVTFTDWLPGLIQSCWSLSGAAAVFEITHSAAFGRGQLNRWTSLGMLCSRSLLSVEHGQLLIPYMANHLWYQTQIVYAAHTYLTLSSRNPTF